MLFLPGYLPAIDLSSALLSSVQRNAIENLIDGTCTIKQEDGSLFSLSFPDQDTFPSDRPVQTSNLTRKNIHSAVGVLADRYSTNAPHLARARREGFTFIYFDKKTPSENKVVNERMVTASAVTVMKERAVYLNIPLIEAMTSSNGKSFESNLLITLSHEACHIIRKSSYSAMDKEESLQAVKDMAVAEEKTLLPVDKDLRAIFLEEFVAECAELLTERSLENLLFRPSEAFLEGEAALLNLRAKGCIASAFRNIFEASVYETLSQALGQPDGSSTPYKKAVMRLITWVNSGEAMSGAIEALKDLGLLPR